jgi:hypothetical protein
VLAAVAAVTAAVGVSSVGAAPIAGAQHVSRTDLPDFLFTSAPGCPSYVPHDYLEGEAYGTSVTSSIKGWIGPIDQTTFLQQVDLRAHLTGSIQDAAGNTYSVNGTFTEKQTIDSNTSFDIVFDGTGKLRFTGPTGSVVGRADFRFVTAPESFELTFTSISKCTISS